MLKLHPDSDCDVCLDPYSFSNPAKTPHAIACGHIFCLECLGQLNHPTSCPLCRKSFGSDRVKKLHVDRYIPGPRDVAMGDAWNLVERLSKCARSDVAIQTTDELIGEAQQWLDANGHKELFPEVDAVFSALIKYKSLQERFHDQQATNASLSARLRREEAMRDEDRKGALVEHGLIRRIKELETQLEFYRHHFPGVRDLAREHRPRGNSSASEDRANGGRDLNPVNPLPLPPKQMWYPLTARNPNFVPPGSSQEHYLRTGIPPLPPQPYAHETGACAVFYEGAHYEDRVVPQSVRDMASRDVGPERERARSRSGHRDRSAERSRWRGGESEKDRYKRRRDRHRRDTLGRGDDDVADRTGLSGEQPHPMNALGIQPLHPGQGLYAPVAPPVTSTSGSVRHQESYRSSSAGGASSSYPATSHGTAPAMSTTTSAPGPRHREVPQIYSSAGTSHAPRTDPIYRPSSTPSGPMLSSWVAPDPSNPSLNSLGLSAPGQGVSGVNPQMLSTAPTTARDSVSSWGTADSGQTNGDLFSTLRPLASAPADSGPAGDLFPMQDGQLLGVGRSAHIASPRPQFPRTPAPPAFGSLPGHDTDARPRSRHSNHARSRSQTSLNYDPSQPSAPQSFTPEDRGFPYAAVPPRPPPQSIPIPYVPPRSTTPASRPPSHPMPMVPPPFPHIPTPQPTIAVSRPPQNIYHPSFYGASTSQSQNSSHRTHHQH